MTSEPSISTPRSAAPEWAAEVLGRVSSATMVRFEEPLGPRTTLRIGGPAAVYVEPAHEADLAAVLQFCAERGRPLFILGRGSNLLVKDGGFPGVVIALAQPAFCRIEVAAPRVECGAGARLKEVVLEAKRNRLAGLEFLQGIPGTIGGALRMNAGAMGGAIFDLVTTVRLMDFSGRIAERTAAEMNARYRGCPALKQQIALAACLEGRPGIGDEIERRMAELSRKRWQTQPAAPSAGCLFKNPASIPAGRLIDELGLKGTRVGGAMVSPKHGNFIVNDGNATASDVLELIEIIQHRARLERGVELETEVEIIGE